ncbi:MAG: hypothetical protein ABEJ42_07675 [Halobacteriaceae archaeon]
MEPEDPERSVKPFCGLAIEDAAELAVDRGLADDPGTAAGLLSRVAEDGVVTAAAVEDAVADAAGAVSTAETRVELAELALDDAREAAAPLADVDAVDSRLAEHRTAVAALGDRIAAHRDALAALRERDDDAFGTARRVADLVDAAEATTARADDRQAALDDLEQWFGSHDHRVADLRAEVTALAEAVDALEETASALERAADGAGEPTDLSVAPGEAWRDAVLHQRLHRLAVADLRAERGDVTTLADRVDAQAERADATDESLDAVASALDDAADRVEALGDRLSAAATDEWTARHGDAVASADDALGAETPPVDWGRVGEVVEAARADGDEG